MIKEKKGKNNSMRAMIIMGSDKQKESDNNGMENFLTRRETDSVEGCSKVSSIFA